jgi:hypothetical protein
MARRIVAYTKEGCHLCENVIAVLQKMQKPEGFELITEDITKDPRLFERYKEIIPVVEVDGRIRLAGAVLSNQRTLDAVLQKALSEV